MHQYFFIYQNYSYSDNVKATEISDNPSVYSTACSEQ